MMGASNRAAVRASQHGELQPPGADPVPKAARRVLVSRSAASLEYVGRESEDDAVTVRQEVLEVARDLTARGLVPFSPQQVIDELRRRGTSYQESSIRTHVVDFMCIDAPTKHGVSYPDLRRVGRGQYVLASEAGRQTAVRNVRVERPSTSPVTTRAATPTEIGGRPWSWEGNVQRVFADYLIAKGWDVTSTADTASREAGPDVVAHRNGIDLIAEVKGYPDSSRASVNTQARHYAAGALLTGLLAWGDHPQAQIGLVFPDAKTYRNLLRRLRTPLERLNISVWIVHENGKTETWLDGHGAQP
jgi:hypothetical protein